MPNRMLRDWTDSDKVNSLSPQAECFFTRLIMKVDDYGCFPADPRLLKANLFPLKLNAIREADISRWLADAQKAGLIALYVSSNKQYLQIQDFRQRLDRAKAKYPLPPSDTSLPTSGNPVELVNDFPAELETEVEKEVVSVVGGEPPPSPAVKKPDGKTLEVKQQEMLQRQALFRQELKPYESHYGKEMVTAFFEHFSEANLSQTKMLFEMQKTWDTKRRLGKWESNEQRFGAKKAVNSQQSSGSSAAEEFKKHLNKS